MSHPTPNLSRPRPSPAAPRGFTIIEIVMSVLVLGLLISLLIVGVRRARSTVQKTVDEGTVHSLVMGVIQFKKDYGFLPPLVKDDHSASNGVRLARIVVPPAAPGTTPINHVEVYDFVNPSTLDRALLEGPDSPPATDPFSDADRFSTLSLPVYLAGALKASYSASTPATSIDGVTGPGFYAPNGDGTWQVPFSRRASSSPPLINIGGSALKLVTSDSQPLELSLQDRNGVPIRYYRWLSKKVTPPAILQLTDLRVPVIVARDATLYPATPPSRDIALNAQARGAEFAIVAAGQNKVFGDESIRELREVLANNNATDEELRRIAEADNVVEVGQ